MYNLQGGRHSVKKNTPNLRSLFMPVNLIPYQSVFINDFKCFILSLALAMHFIVFPFSRNVYIFCKQTLLFFVLMLHSSTLISVADKLPT